MAKIEVTPFKHGYGKREVIVNGIIIPDVISVKHEVSVKDLDVVVITIHCEEYNASLFQENGVKNGEEE